MTIAYEKHLRDFHFWSGAATNAAKLTPEELDALEEWYNMTLELGDDIPSATEINDDMWFNFGGVCNAIGLRYDEEKDEVIREEGE